MIRPNPGGKSGDAMTETEIQRPRGLNSNDLLLNLTLLNAVAGAVVAWGLGLSIGQSFGIGVGVLFVVMPLVLALSYVVLIPTQQQDWHAGLANIILIVTLLGVLAAGIYVFVL